MTAGPCLPLFRSELAAELDRLSEIEELLLSVVHGAKEDALYLQYQPIIHSASHKVCGFEALARLDGGPLGTISLGVYSHRGRKPAHRTPG